MPVSSSEENIINREAVSQSEENHSESLMSDLSEDIMSEGVDINESEGDGESFADEESFSELTQMWMRRALDHGLIHRQRYYREFITHYLPQLDSLDGREITEQERVLSREVVAKHFVAEPFAEFHKHGEKSLFSMPQILQEWQTGIK